MREGVFRFDTKVLDAWGDYHKVTRHVDQLHVPFVLRLTFIVRLLKPDSETTRIRLDFSAARVVHLNDEVGTGGD